MIVNKCIVGLISVEQVDIWPYAYELVEVKKYEIPALLQDWCPKTLSGSVGPWQKISGKRTIKASAYTKFK